MKNIQFCLSSLDNPRNYNCFLLDDILLHVLNYVHDTKISLVSYQFYTVNRDFVVKCYHLHHYIPTIKEIVNQSSLVGKDFSPNIISIEFNHQISILKFNNINDSLLPNNIYVMSNIINTLGELLQDPYTQCKICFVSTETNESKEGDYVSLLELLDLIGFSKVIAANKLNIIKILSSNYCDTPDMFNVIINSLDTNDQAIFLNYLGASFEKRTGKTFDQCILKLSPKKLEEFLYGMIDISNNITNNNSIFYMNKNKTIFVSKIYDNPTIPIYNKDALPEYQWILDQL
jgi:hypothetical protein